MCAAEQTNDTTSYSLDFQISIEAAMKSDADLQHEVQDELAKLHSSGADEISVHVLQGVVQK